MTPDLLFPLFMAWGVSPSPSAHEVQTGITVAVEGSAAVGVRPAGGAGLAVGFTPHARFRAELSAQTGTSWELCPDCGATAANLELRGTLVRNQHFNLSPWVLGNATTGTTEATVGVAAEGGGERLRVDASWPVLSSQFKLTTLRIMPEHGVSYAWTSTQATRVAVVGLEPAVALQHRARMGQTTLESTLRYGEEGLGAELGLNLHF